MIQWYILETTKRRIHSTITPLADAKDKVEEQDVLKRLATEGLLSLDQFKQLSTVVEKLTPEMIARALPRPCVI